MKKKNNQQPTHNAAGNPHTPVSKTLLGAVGDTDPRQENATETLVHGTSNYTMGPSAPNLFQPIIVAAGLKN